MRTGEKGRVARVDIPCLSDDYMKDSDIDTVVAMLTTGQLCPQTKEGSYTEEYVWSGSRVGKRANKGQKCDLAMDRFKIV